MKLLKPLIFYFFLIQQLQAQNNTYWQQQADFTIDVTLDDHRHELHAFEEIRYTNNSPDSLSNLYFHLWPNAYLNRKTAFAQQKIENGETDFYFADQETRGWIDSLNFRINGQDVYWEYDAEHHDIARIIPTRSILPGETITISTPFRVKLPESFSRLGHVQQQYQVTQWYPKPAVYDKNGWHPMPYLDQGEFYSEFGTFNVSITLPANYVVGATGTLQNQEEIEFLQARENETVTLTQPAPFIASSTETKTLHYAQENVHDFAWFADKTYLVKTGTVTLPNSGRQVELLAIYNYENAAVWEDIIEYMQDAVYKYSLWIGDYAYPAVTVVDGALSAGAGMEYPMITVLGADSKFNLELVTMHEIGHNWFYGILASNERRYPWMDEGINSFYELRYIREKENLDNRKLFGIQLDENNQELFRYFNLDQYDYYKGNNLAYLISARQNLDQPIDLAAPDFSKFNYFTIIYSKAAVVMDHLYHYLGPELFDRAMQEYYRYWQFRHPYPEDLQAVVEETTGKELDWFFGDLVSSDRKLDYKFVSAKSKSGTLVATIKNRTGLESPIPVTTVKNGEVLDTIWLEGFKGKQEINLQGNPDQLVIDRAWITTELFRKNNFIRTSGILKKRKPLSLKLFGALPDPEVNQLFFLPIIGGNTADKFMAGAAFYNQLIPEKPFNYLLAPMYSFGLDKLAGTGFLSHMLYPGEFLREIQFKIGATAFAGFEKLNPEVNFSIQPQVRSSPRQTISFSYPFIRVDQDVLPFYDRSYEIFRARYELETGNAIFKYRNLLEFQSKENDFEQLSNTFDFSWQHQKNKYLDLRLFYGIFLSNNFSNPVYRLYLGGSMDYLMKEVFLDRTGISPWMNAFSNQTDLGQGGFKGYAGPGSNEWLAALNLQLDLPNISLFSVFGDIGFLGGEEEVFYDAGLSFRIIRNIAEIYVPVIGSPFAGTFPEDFRELQHNIRFRLNLTALNPLKLLNENLR